MATHCYSPRGAVEPGRAQQHPAPQSWPCSEQEGRDELSEKSKLQSEMRLWLCDQQCPALPRLLSQTGGFLQQLLLSSPNHLPGKEHPGSHLPRVQDGPDQAQQYYTEIQIHFLHWDSFQIFVRQPPREVIHFQQMKSSRLQNLLRLPQM